MKVTRRAALVGAALLVGGLSTRLFSREVGIRSASVEFDPDRPGRPVPPLLFGSNLQWTDLGDGALVKRGGDFAWNPDLFRRLAESGARLLRFPGGALANTYRWRSGIGPRSLREPGLDFSGKPEPSVFGTDEFLALCASAGVAGLVTVNLSAGAAEAADWLAYLNADTAGGTDRARAGNGAPRPPGVQFVEVGNELYAEREHGSLPPVEYGRAVARFAAALRTRFPGVQVGAMLEGAFQQAAWARAAVPKLLDWNEAVLASCGREIDFVALHFATPFDTHWLEDDLHRLVWAGPVAFEMTVAAVKQLLQRHARADLPIVVSEYTTFFGETTAPSARIAGTENALFCALMLFAMMRDPSIVAAANWSLLNNGTFGLLATDRDGRLSPRPAFDCFRLLAGFAGARLVPLRITAPGYAVTAKGNVPALAEVPMLDGVGRQAAGGSFELALVNRSPTDLLQVSIATPAHRVALDGGESYAMVRDDPASWRLDRIAAAGAADSLSIPLPPASFASLHLRTAGPRAG